MTLRTTSPSSPRLGIFAERHVGIGSAAAAVEPHLRSVPNLNWTDVTYAGPKGRIERSPLPVKLHGPLRGFLQTRAGLRRGPYDALLFLTHNPAVLWPQVIARTPTLLWTDVTPSLLDAQAAKYGHAVDALALVRRLKRAAVRRTFASATCASAGPNGRAAPSCATTASRRIGRASCRQASISSTSHSQHALRTQPCQACCSSAVTSCARAATCCSTCFGSIYADGARSTWSLVTRSPRRRVSACIGP